MPRTGSRSKLAPFSTLAVVALLATLWVAAPVSSAQQPAAAETCAGAPVTVYIGLGDLPTPGDDVILGTDSNDVIAAGSGNDLICAGAGDDAVWGQAGEDTIFGGAGADRLRGGDGNDLVSGDAGSDDLNGGRDDDRVFGGDGDDTVVRGGTGDDIVDGGAGNDLRISGNGGEDEVRGGPGNDALLSGGPRPDILSGGDGNDVLKGLGGADILRGEAGSDELRGGNQPDQLFGGSGTDICIGGNQTDVSLSCEDLRTIENDLDALGASQPAAGLRIRMARANWRSGYPQAEILHDLLEELGYEVDSPSFREFAPDLAYRSIAEGTSDFWANSWYPGHLAWWEDTLPDGGQIGDHLTRVGEPMMRGGGLQGFLVTKQWVDDFGFTTLEEVNADPALWGALDTDGNGKGEIFGCPFTWTCDNIIDDMIDFADLDNLEQISTNYDAIFAEFLYRVDRGIPAIAYTWAPTSYIVDADIGESTMWLSMRDESVLNRPLDPFSYNQGEGFGDLPPSLCTYGPDGCQLGWAAADIEITANVTWLAANPIAAALFNEFAPPMQDMAELGVAYSNSNGSQAALTQIAQGWIAENRELVDEWLAITRLAAP